MVHIAGGGIRTPQRLNSASRNRASNGTLWATSTRPVSSCQTVAAGSAKAGAPSTPAALMPWILVGPTSRPGLISVLNSAMICPSVLRWITATSTTRSDRGYNPVVSRSTTASPPGTGSCRNSI